MLFADGGLDLADFDFRQQRGFLVQIIGHRRQPRRDDAADVIAPGIHHVKRDRRAKVHHDDRRAKMKFCRDGVGQPVGADANPAWDNQCPRREWFGDSVRASPNFQMRRTALRTSGVARGTTLHMTAPLIFLVPTSFLRSATALPSNHDRVGMLVCFTHAFFIGQPDMRVRVADVEE